MDQLSDLVSFIAKALVDDPDAVEVEAIEGDKTIILELTVGDGDLGKVIGKDGRTARAMRTLLSATCAKQSRRAVLEILE
ncbi:MAG: KH domain-containing protein [Myxococcales bacterium]|nr:KH domain-containing protein [Myxococcales bacterium]